MEGDRGKTSVRTLFLWYVSSAAVSVSGVGRLPIRALLALSGAFSPEDITALTAAHEGVLHSLRLDRRDLAATLVAKRIIELARNGGRNPVALRDAVLKSFRNDPGSSGL